jgi:hypothetical protein
MGASVDNQAPQPYKSRAGKYAINMLLIDTACKTLFSIMLKEYSVTEHIVMFIA